VGQRQQDGQLLPNQPVFAQAIVAAIARAEHIDNVLCFWYNVIDASKQFD